MAKYAEMVQGLKDKFVEFRVQQIHREENKKSYYLSKLASSAGGGAGGKITLLTAENQLSALEVGAVENDRDWRIPIFHFLRTGQRMEGVSKKVSCARYCLMGDHLYKRSFSNPYLRCISKRDGNLVLKDIHEESGESHAGLRDVARKALRDGYFWPTLVRDAQELVRKCPKCQRHGTLIHVPSKELGVMHSPCPSEKWRIDIVEKFPVASGGKVFLIFVEDYFSIWVKIATVNKIDEVAIIRFLKRNICCRFSIPRIRVSDNGTQFARYEVHNWCQEMGIIQRFVSLAHTEANGQVKVTNRTIVDRIRTRLDKASGACVEELDAVLWAYRTNPRAATGESPFNLVYGSSAVMSIDVKVKTHRILNYDENQNAELRKKNLVMVAEEQEIAHLRNEHYKDQIRVAYNNRVKTRRFEKED